MIKRLLLTSLIIGLVSVSFFGSALFFDAPRQLVAKILSVYPISAVIGMLQRVTIPANDADCMEALKTLDADFRVQSGFVNGEGCGSEYVVRLSRVGEAKIANSPLLSCSMATQLVHFEKLFLQPIAEDVLGAKVAQINHLGTYNCRSMRQFKAVKSQHAFANAIDVSGFALADGRKVDVAKDWKEGGKNSEFLRSLKPGACSSFRVSVSPDGDANHWNHFHWDTGLYRSCS